MKVGIRNFLLILMLTLCSGLFSACCSPANVKVVVNFIEPPDGVEVSSRVETLPYGGSTTIVFYLPEGYDQEGVSVKLDGKPYDFTITYDNPNLEERLLYSTGKTVSIEVLKIPRNVTLDIDLTGAGPKNLKFSASTDLMNESKGNLKVVVIDKGTSTTLNKVDSSVYVTERPFTNGVADVYYNEDIFICYTRLGNCGEIDTLYSKIGDFTGNYLELGDLKYLKYDVAKKGNEYYNLENDSYYYNTRLYYFGRVKEGMEFYSGIPGYAVEPGFVLPNNENKFSLITTNSDYNSDALTIDIFRPTDEAFVDNDNFFKIGTQTIKKIEKYDVDGQLKNSDDKYELNFRYDVVDMYIGSDIQNDVFLTNIEKQVLSDEIYIRIKTELPIDEAFRINLLSYEKQKNKESMPYLTFDMQNVILSEDKLTAFVKIDKNTISKFLLDRTKNFNNNIVNYQTGNAILYVELTQEYIDNQRINRSFIYTAINYPTIYNGTVNNRNDDYKAEFYVENVDGSKDYGLLDFHRLNEDLVFLPSSKLFSSRKNENNCYEFYKTLRINVIGPEKTDCFSPIITQVNLRESINDDPITGNGGLSLSAEKNGVEGANVLITESELLNIPSDQYLIRIYINVSSVDTGLYNLRFDDMEFSDLSNAIYIAKNIDFGNTTTDFIRIDNITISDSVTQAALRSINFGQNRDIYFFTVGNIDWDIYYDYSDGHTRKISDTKPLLDALGNHRKIVLSNGTQYNIYVKYQSVNIYGSNSRNYNARLNGN